MAKTPSQAVPRAPSPFRKIPAVDSVLRRKEVAALAQEHGRALVTGAVREILERIRKGMSESAGPEAAEFLQELQQLVAQAIARRTAPSLRRVINATGIIVHTNLGRAVLSTEARARVAQAAGAYCTLEYDLEEGARGSRATHLESRLSLLFPARGAVAVNNNAAAVLLALNTLAEGREVIVSRGELVEIGGSFRIPDVMAKSGAIMREVGTTNRTRLADYEEAIGPRTGLLLKVHQSNYRILGFTEHAEVADLAALAHRHGLTLMVDQGGGALVDMAGASIKDEPTVEELLAHGADLVTFSGDKILGGPQAGLAVGVPDLVARMRGNPLYRAVRLDKMTIAALEATLDAYVRGTARDDLPVQRMIFMPREAIENRARLLAARLGPRLGPAFDVGLEEGVSRVGGGAAPGTELPTMLVRVAPNDPARVSLTEWEARLRRAAVPVIARVHDGALLLDLRTVDPTEEEDLVETLAGS